MTTCKQCAKDREKAEAMMSAGGIDTTSPVAQGLLEKVRCHEHLKTAATPEGTDA